MKKQNNYYKGLKSTIDGSGFKIEEITRSCTSPNTRSINILASDIFIRLLRMINVIPGYEGGSKTNRCLIRDRDPIYNLRLPANIQSGSTHETSKSKSRLL